jgi:hypothetical protein
MAWAVDFAILSGVERRARANVQEPRGQGKDQVGARNSNTPALGRRCGRAQGERAHLKCGAQSVSTSRPAQSQS